MTDILDEVLNDQNEEKRLIFFKKLLPIVIIISLIVITIMVVNNNNKNNQIKNNKQNGDIFVKAINLENTESNKELALNTLDSLSTSDSKVKEVALLEQVAIKISEKKYPEAKELLNKIIENKDYSEITTSYARVSWLSLVIDDKDLTTEDKERLVKYLNYFDNENKPFWATASIMQAIWNIRNNMYVDAEKNLRNLLSSNNVPDLLKDQARALLANFQKN